MTYEPFAQPGQPHQPVMAQPGAGAGSENFFAALLDLSFSQFITVKFAKYLYLLAIILHVLVVLFVAAGTSVREGSFLVFLGTLIGGSLLALLSLIGVRLGLELAVAIIRTAQNTAR
ncbi:DUF4282 domain-containing protein [Corynebacterium nasicanis]|uniref:DUF4282 domain-containing protein n=1 Tax=Corynebacterium nasicanis TaxID=1448267 RepID=A0ABW1QG55_9CORY